MTNPNETNPPNPAAKDLPREPGIAQGGGETGASSSEGMADVSVPQDDDELNDALEDTFPASDPINFAGSSIGSPDREETEEPPVGAHPMGGAENRESGLEHVSRAAFGVEDDDNGDDEEDENGSSSRTPPVL